MVVQTSRAEMHELVDSLSDEELMAAKRYVEFLRSDYTDPLLWALDTAPEDDEPTTPEEDAGAEEARQEYLRGETISLEELKRTLLL